MAGDKRRKILRRHVLVVVMIVLGVLIAASCGGNQPAPAPEASELPVMREAPDFELTDQDETRITLAELSGKVVLMNFIYTSCPSACQLQNFDLKSVWGSLDEASRRELVIVSISFDPEVDTPQVLKEYAQSWGFDIPGWYFLTGSLEEVAKVLEEYGVFYELVPAGEHTHPDGEVEFHGRGFIHMNQAILIDQDGMIRSQYLGMQIGGQVLPRETMLEDVRALLQSP
jgi:protein SCO1/2